MNMKYVLSRFIHRLNQNKLLIQRHTFYIPLTFRLSPELDAASIFIFAFDAASNRGRFMFREIRYTFFGFRGQPRNLIPAKPLTLPIREI